MINLRNNKLLVILVAICLFSTTYGQQTEKTKRQLNFEIYGPIIPSDHFSEVTHYAFFHIVEDRRISENWTEPWITLTSQWKQMSEKQRQFIHKLQNDYQYRSIASRTGISRHLLTNLITLKHRKEQKPTRFSRLVGKMRKKWLRRL